jgi:membrane protein
MNRKKFLDLVKQSFSEWSEDKASRLAAALAYYTIFSIPPLLVIVIAIAGQFFGREAAQQQLLAQVGSTIGSEGSAALEGILEGADRPEGNTIAIIIGVVTLFLGASGVFAQLQDGLNTVWDVMAAPGRGIIATLKTRFISFTMVLGTGFLLLVSLVLTAVLAVLSDYMLRVVPGAAILIRILNFLVSLGVITLLFALIYKVVPDVEIKWRDVWVGALVTAALFVLGRFAISLYLQYSDPTSTFGAAGSLILIALWVYYSAQILFLGAEFTQVYAKLYGSELKPERGAIPITEQARATQGIPSEATKREAIAGSRGTQQTGSGYGYETRAVAAGGGPMGSQAAPGRSQAAVSTQTHSSSPGGVLGKLSYLILVLPTVLYGAWRAWRTPVRR